MLCALRWAGLVLYALRLGALCLARAQRRCHVELPAALLRAILAQCLAD